MEHQKEARVRRDRDHDVLLVGEQCKFLFPSHRDIGRESFPEQNGTVDSGSAITQSAAPHSVSGNRADAR